MDKSILILAIIAGLVLLIVAVVYFITPASSLPPFLPGFDPNLNTIHYKHGIGSLVLALAIFAFAWFRSGKSTQEVKGDSSSDN